jgi:hypothetical protein
MSNEKSFSLNRCSRNEKVKKNNKTPSIETPRETENRLARWCDLQRRNYRKGLLTQDQIRQLESLPYWHW